MFQESHRAGGGWADAGLDGARSAGESHLEISLDDGLARFASNSLFRTAGYCGVGRSIPCGTGREKLGKSKGVEVLYVLSFPLSRRDFTHRTKIRRRLGAVCDRAVSGGLFEAFSHGGRGVFVGSRHLIHILNQWGCRDCSIYLSGSTQRFFNLSPQSVSESCARSWDYLSRGRYCFMWGDFHLIKIRRFCSERGRCWRSWNLKIGWGSWWGMGRCGRR